MKYHLWLISR